MKLREILQVINETDIIYYNFGDGVRASSADLNAVLCDYALNEQVAEVAIGGSREMPVIKITTE